MHTHYTHTLLRCVLLTINYAVLCQTIIYFCFEQLSTTNTNDNISYDCLINIHFRFKSLQSVIRWSSLELSTPNVVHLETLAGKRKKRILVVATSTLLYWLTIAEPYKQFVISGKSNDTKYRRIHSFIQWHKKIVVADTEAKCLRLVLVEDQKQNTEWESFNLQGNCFSETKSDDNLNGHQLTSPRALVKDPHNQNGAFFADGPRGIYYLDLLSNITALTATIEYGINGSIMSLIVNQAKKAWLVILGNHLLSFRFDERVISNITTFKESNSGKANQNPIIASLVQVDSKHVATLDSWNNHLKIIDLKSGYIWTYCNGRPIDESATLANCSLNRPTAVYLNDGLGLKSLLVATETGITEFFLQNKG